MDRKTKKTIIILLILIISLLITLFGIRFTILPLKGQWEYVNVTLVNNNVKVGDIPKIKIDYHPTKKMIEECPSTDYKAFSTVSIYIDNNFYKIINLNDIHCNENRSLIINLPNNLDIGLHNVTVKIGVMSFLYTGRAKNYRKRCVYDGTTFVWKGILSEREEYFFEEQLKNQCKLFGILKDKLNISYKCHDVKESISRCYCGGEIGPKDEWGCSSFACYDREGSTGPCTNNLGTWRWMDKELTLNPIKDYLLGSEHYDFDYYNYLEYKNMVQTTETLIISSVESIKNETKCKEDIIFTCWDNSNIVQYKCINGVHVPTGNKCPEEPEIKENCSKNPLVCVDMTECINNGWYWYDNSCHLNKKIFLKKYIYFIIGGITFFIVFILYIVKKF